MMEKETKKSGITLIALVITVIVLLILAGVAVSIGLDSDGIFARANKAKDEWNAKVAEEDEKISEIWDLSKTPQTYTVYSLGEEVTVDGEQFFVIEEDDTASKSTITLITKYNLRLDANEQATSNMTNDETILAFCTDPNNTYKGYWADISGIKYPYNLNELESERATVYNRAVTYGLAKGGIGRLLTKSEAEALTANEKIPKIIYGQDYTTNPVATDNSLKFWLGTAYADYSTYFVNGTTIVGGNNSIYAYGGIRPVITITKSSIL